eukprot:362982-Chlamydomonas_euryale.AAC.12
MGAAARGGYIWRRRLGLQPKVVVRTPRRSTATARDTCAGLWLVRLWPVSVSRSEAAAVAAATAVATAASLCMAISGHF